MLDENWERIPDKKLRRRPALLEPREAYCFASAACRLLFGTLKPASEGSNRQHALRGPPIQAHASNGERNDTDQDEIESARLRDHAAALRDVQIWICSFNGV